MKWFWEEMSMTGAWAPVAAPDKPATAKSGGHLRIKKTGGIGPRIRKEPQEIAARHQGLTLDVLKDIYGGAE